MDRQSIYRDLLIAKQEGYTAIDISNNSVEYTNVNGIYHEYGFVDIDDMVIYDKYGDNILKYQLQSLPNVTGSFERKVQVYERDGNKKMTIIIHKGYKFHPLEYLARMDIYNMSIYCNNAYISPKIFETIIATKLTLFDPDIDSKVLSSINSYDVTIMLKNYHVESFKALKCKVFTLYYIPHREHVPIMPKEAYDITLIIIPEAYKKHLTFSSKSKHLQWLRIVLESQKNFSFHINGCPVLESLIINQNYKDNTVITVNASVLKQLRELICNDWKHLMFVSEGDNVLLASRIKEHYIPLTEPLPNMTVFERNLLLDEQYLLMPNLKKLTTNKILESKYIPKHLEEYIIADKTMTSKNISEMIQFDEYLLGMDSIKRMPLILLKNNDLDLIVGNKHDVYYDIYIYDPDEVHNFTLYSEYLFEKTEDLQRALANNARYLKRNVTLESFY